MNHDKLFIVSHGDGLKSHLSLDADGNKSLCGRKMRKFPKKVTQIEVLNPLLIAHVCHKCLKASGVIE